MDRKIEERKRIIKEKLSNDLYVERYDTFKESVVLINRAMDIFDINYQYDYNSFCRDFTEETMKYIENNPDVDISEYSQMYIYTPLIVMSLIEKIKNKYGFKKQKNILKG